MVQVSQQVTQQNKTLHKNRVVNSDPHLYQHCVHAVEVVLRAALLHRLDIKVGGQPLQDVLSHLTQGLLKALAPGRRLAALREQ